MERAAPEFRIGPFSLGDIIALAGVVFMSGALFWRVAALERDADRTAVRVQALEQFIPTNYVRRDEYREDIKELKSLMQQISMDLKTKQDKP